MVSILLASIGITFITIGIIIFVDKLKMFKYGIKVKGEIIDFEKVLVSHINNEKEIVYTTLYKPIIKFKDTDGKYKIVTCDVLDGDKTYKIGGYVTLVYTESEPEYIEIAEKQIVYSNLCKLISMGIMFIIFSVIFMMV